MKGRKQTQRGFTQIELMVSIATVAILASIAIAQLRDYSRRASISEVVMATSHCKSMVTENYAVLTDAPPPGRWGCERTGSTGRYAGSIQTSADGVIRVAIEGLDPLVNGQFIYLAPVKADGNTPMITPDDLGRSVSNWQCGSDWLPVRNALPANCRSDTTTFASQDFN